MVVPWDPTYTRPLHRAAKPAKTGGDRPTLNLTHQRVDDVPLLVSFLIKLRIPETVDGIFPPHPLHQGLSNGWLITLWIAYILSQGDHRKSPVQHWVDRLKYTLETLIGQPIRPVDFNDDRLGLILKRLSHEPAWHELEATLWCVSGEVYALPPLERVRLDATTSFGYHAIDEDGLMQLGQGKDHRPDLPQLKLMAAAAEPAGLFLAGDVHPGNAADDPLDLPLYRRVRALLGQSGLLYTGDCKMAALETRAEMAFNQDFYLTRLPMTGEVASQFASWVEAALTGEKASELARLAATTNGSLWVTSSSGRRPPGWARPNTPGVSACRSSVPRRWPRAKRPPWSDG